MTSSTGTNISLYLTSLHTRTHISQQLTSFQADSGLSRISHTNTRTHACLHKNTHSSERESALFCGFVLVWCKAQVSLALVCLINTHTHARTLRCTHTLYTKSRGQRQTSTCRHANNHTQKHTGWKTHNSEKLSHSINTLTHTQSCTHRRRLQIFTHSPRLQQSKGVSVCVEDAD